MVGNRKRSCLDLVLEDFVTTILPIFKPAVISDHFNQLVNFHPPQFLLPHNPHDFLKVTYLIPFLEIKRTFFTPKLASTPNGKLTYKMEVVKNIEYSTPLNSDQEVS